MNEKIYDELWFGDGPPKHFVKNAEGFYRPPPKDDAHYIGMSMFFLGLPFVIYGLKVIFLG